MQRSVLIIDDEPAARLLLRQYLEASGQFRILGEYDNGLEAVAGIDHREPDIVFLDIRMPGRSGLQVAQEIVHVPQIIFTTGCDQFALRAFDANATDYLLKPYTRERFEQAIRKVLQQESPRPPAPATGVTEPLSTILVESGSRLVSLKVKEVICLEADRDYTWLHTAARSYLSNYGISQLEQRLSRPDFIRVHRSYMVNIHHIREVHREGSTAELTTSDNRVIHVSRTYMPELKKLIY
ncbi:MAG TPA: LytTR family DNA-binding domain-containing protein [Chitinophagaceae bacterium]|jgi:two-component system LytT family response regulator|nr:LytTR family DNA-binding domain-containing protein [Chitinophagaceae bacterium]